MRYIPARRPNYASGETQLFFNVRSSKKRGARTCVFTTGPESQKKTLPDTVPEEVPGNVPENVPGKFWYCFVSTDFAGTFSGTLPGTFSGVLPGTCFGHLFGHNTAHAFRHKTL